MYSIREDQIMRARVGLKRINMHTSSPVPVAVKEKKNTYNDAYEFVYVIIIQY